MPSLKSEERLRKLKEKQARVNAELRRAEARARIAERKRQTRLQFLTGRMVLDQVERGALAEQEVKVMLDRFLKRPSDRALFDLPPPAFQRVRDLRAEGNSHRHIAKILKAEGVPLPPGFGPKWSHTVVGRVLRQLEAAAPSPPTTEEGRHGSAE